MFGPQVLAEGFLFAFFLPTPLYLLSYKLHFFLPQNSSAFPVSPFIVHLIAMPRPYYESFPAFSVFR
jgi:hypothetical protein